MFVLPAPLVGLKGCSPPALDCQADQLSGTASKYSLEIGLGGLTFKPRASSGRARRIAECARLLFDCAPAIRLDRGDAARWLGGAKPVNVVSIKQGKGQ